MTGSMRVSTGFVAVACWLLGPGVAPGSGSTAAPSTEELAAATYRGLGESPVALVDGHWEGEPATEGAASVPRVDLSKTFRVAGDLSGDRSDEAVALLFQDLGGSGVFSYLAVVGRSGAGGAENLATVRLGDRVQLRSAAIVDGGLLVETVEAGPGDAACCPGQKRRRTFALEGDELVELSNEDGGRLSLSDLEGATWRLIRWADDEPVAKSHEIDLRIDGGRIAGGSGCNRYRGVVEAGDLPGELSLEQPLARTQMACPPPLGDLESRFLTALQNVRRFRFAAGQLVLDWSAAESGGSLSFGAKASR